MKTSEIAHDQEEERREDQEAEARWRDVARCNGAGAEEDDGWEWREGCRTCLRRTAPRPGQVWMMEPPSIIAFECEFRIPPDDREETLTNE